MTHCAASWATPDWVNSLSTTWTATIDDRDRTSPNGSGPAANVNGEFLWNNVTNGNNGTVSDAGNPKAPGSVFTGTRSGSNRNEYEWQAYGQAIQDDPWNTSAAPLLGPLAPPNSCFFQIDQNAPTQAVTVTPNLPTTGEAVGTQYEITLSDSDTDTAPRGTGTVNDVVGFYYGIDNSQPATYVPVTAGSSPPSATIKLTAFTPEEIDLYVQAVDRAGNKGPLPAGGGPSLTIDTVAGQGNISTLGWWRLNNHGTDSAIPARTTGNDLALSAAGSSWGCPTSAGASPAGYSCSLGLDGTAGYASGQPALANDDFFSVSAWVNVDPSCAGQGVYCAVLSQDAAAKAGSSHVSGFTLGYQPSGYAEAVYESGGTPSTASTQCPCWVFSMPQSNTAGDEYKPDTASSGWYLAAVHATQAPGTWTQLTGVFYKSNGELLLYVNGGDATAGDGNPAAVSPGSVQVWSTAATGAFRVGADWDGTGLADLFAGSVSDVCAFYGVLGASQVQTLYSSGSGDGCQTLYNTNP